MRFQYYVDEDGESTIGLWVPKRGCFIDVTAQDEQLWAAMLPDGKKLRKEIETWISKGAADGVPVDTKGLAISSALHVQPCTLACLGKCYADHAREFSGDTLHRATEAEARRAIVGYTLMCDYSERSYQLEHGGQWTKGKSYDTFAPFGPVLVTKDEIPNPDNLELELKVNGEVRQKANTSQLIMPVAQLVAYVSRFMTLNPGDVVSTGTPGGVALGMNPPVYLKPGDVVEFSCPAIGTVTQVVEAE